MIDQAQALREKIQRQRAWQATSAKIITVTSGKGGVGKSNFTLNFALALRRYGYRVLVFDADIGLANLDVLMGVTPRYNLYHLLHSEKKLSDIIHTGPEGLKIIAGGSGFTDLLKLTEEDLERFASQINQLSDSMDFILFDTGAGLSKETIKFIVASHETIVVTTPEPTAITDAYAIMKMVNSMKYDISYKLVVNRTSSERQGKHTADKITLAARRFLDIHISTLGFVADDHHVMKAVCKQVPFSIEYPGCAASRSVNRLASAYLNGQTHAKPASNGVKGFINRMIKVLS